MMKLAPIAGSAALLLLAAAGLSDSGEARCITVQRQAEMASYPVAGGDLLRISFTHSIYGSQVEERFQVKDESFDSLDVRYSERRLVEFYGYESATWIAGSWVAHPAKRRYQILALRGSQDSPIRISFRNRIITVSDGAARISLEPCPGTIHG
jgi:hypothetical protein